jgi:hypothetical protein
MAASEVTRREVLKGAAAVGVLGALGVPAAALAEDGPNVRIRWDIVNILTPCVTPGGHSSARTIDGARITITGSGTFPNTNRCRKNVTGGGTWTITPGTAASGCFSGSGDFTVTELLSWVVAPGTFPPGLTCDAIGDPADIRAGLAKLRVSYSNGETGVLTISCHLFGTPDCVYEGITTTMRYEDFTFPEPPAPGVDANRNAFHIVRPPARH